MTDIFNAILGDSAAPYALISSPNRYIGTIIADVTVREVHTDEDSITVHPVETGTPISDHVFANPKVIEISFGFSDSTAGYTGSVQQNYEAILALKAQRTTFDVSTGKRLYQNMLFSRVEVVTDETSEFALMVVARLQEVIITSTTTAGTPSSTATGSNLSQQNQADPASTAPITNSGNQTLQFALTGTGYAASTAPLGSIPSNYFVNPTNTTPY